MSDVRSLLRQQRASRRIEHPFVAYSDAGKLLCTLCREHIKTESLWDSHVRSDAHKGRVIKAQSLNGNGQDEKRQTAPKRKHDEDDESPDTNGDVEMEDAARRKRSKPETTTSLQVQESKVDDEPRDQALTPPRLTRRTSTALTPSQGVEMQIPSRPATPAQRDGSSASIPGTQSNPQISQSATTTTLSSHRPSNLATDDRPITTAPQVDESEWAAFEADIAATSVSYSQDAVISAPAMTAEETAAAAEAEKEEAEKRRARADVDLEDEKEEATRALEEEFEEMEELEARVRRLKEKREALRKRGESFDQDGRPVRPVGLVNEDKNGPIIEQDDAEEEDEDDEDDWDGFRFRGA